MKIKLLKITYFSPTGTTKLIIKTIAKSINSKNVEFIDITQSDIRGKEVSVSKDELLIIASPVYGGRLPIILSDWLHSIKVNKAPVVCVVVYGNRNYDDALLELEDIMIENGGVPIAGAAFIGEHSFSSNQIPIAESRPDKNDLNYAKIFGNKIKEKLSAINSIKEINEVKIPGKYPYKELKESLSLDFMSISDKCTNCGICAEVCPVNAIDFNNIFLLDKEKCLLCCACIKRCPENARTMKKGKLNDIAIRLNKTCEQRKEPELFF